MACFKNEKFKNVKLPVSPLITHLPDLQLCLWKVSLNIAIYRGVLSNFRLLRGINLENELHFSLSCKRCKSGQF